VFVFVPFYVVSKSNAHQTANAASLVKTVEYAFDSASI
jgi:hypothetical protein